MKQTIRVLLADDHAMVRDGLASVPGDAEDLEVVATAANGFEAVQQALRTQRNYLECDGDLRTSPHRPRSSHG